MPRGAEWFEKFDRITANFTYIRWLGDREGIEKVTKTWDKIVVDRMQELRSWVDACYQKQKRGVTIYAYAKNHYAGHGPALKYSEASGMRRGLPEPGEPRRMRQESSLFDSWRIYPSGSYVLSDSLATSVKSSTKA